jgi:hypothetical protein
LKSHWCPHSIIACMKYELPEELKEQVAPQARLNAKKRIDEEFAIAQTLLGEGRYKEALKKFKWVFANDASYDLFLPGREITKLCKNYPPAATVIKRWRNDKEKLLIQHNGDSKLIGQWDTLNSCLGEKNRTLEVFMQLEASGAPKRLRHSILYRIWQRIARAKKYEMLREYLPTLGFHLLLNAVEYDSLVLFPGHRKLGKKDRSYELARHVLYALGDGTMCCEVAFALGDKRVATAFASKILSIECSDRVYAGLIKAAIRARAYTEAIALFNDARDKFTPRRLRQSNKAIKALPKRQLALLNE